MDRAPMCVRGICASIFVIFASLSSASASSPKDWGRALSPTLETPQVIGSPAAGCLAGGVALDQEGEGFEVLRPERKRFFGHPDLLKFIHWLGHRSAQESLGTLLIGDLSQPRGGPMVYGHGSHQNGLDVDIMFRVTDKPLSKAERSNPMIVSVVSGHDVDPSRWTDSFTHLLEITSKSPQVERIFVNPAIKQSLCRHTPPSERGWLHKLRPWWGHDDHFHIRLACPEGSSNCKTQAPPPDGDGCGYEVESWLQRPTLNIASNKPNTRNVSLPKECIHILNGH